MNTNHPHLKVKLNNLHQKRDSDSFIATTGNNIIESAINLLNRITESYDPDTAQEIERRFINSIRSGDPRKFKRGIDKIVEARKSDDTK